MATAKTGSGRESVLRDGSFRHLFAAATVSNFGNMLHAIALPFVAIAVLDASPAGRGSSRWGSSTDSSRCSA
jgi:hypothetical protein